MGGGADELRHLLHVVCGQQHHLLILREVFLEDLVQQPLPPQLGGPRMGTVGPGVAGTTEDREGAGRGDQRSQESMAMEGLREGTAQGSQDQHLPATPQGWVALTWGVIFCSCPRVTLLYTELMSRRRSSYSDTVIWG